MNRERLLDIGKYAMLVIWAVGLFGGIVYTNRNWNAENVDWTTPDPDIVLGETGRATSVYIDQGPLWLVRFLFDPPWWFPVLTYATLALVALIALWKIYDRGIDPDVLEEVINRAVMLIAIAAAVVGLKVTSLFPYAVDVAGGLLVGLVVTYYTRKNVDWLELVDVERGEMGDA